MFQNLRQPARPASREAAPESTAARTDGPGVVKPGTLSRLLAELAHLPEGDPAQPLGGGLAPGDVVGRFELVREIGRGGFGVVWEARDRELGRSVAFKWVRAGGASAVREERLLAEAEAAAQLSHPNLVTLHDVGRCDRGPYLVLELLRGETLAARLARGPLPTAEAVRVATEVARGVAHAHAHGVVHRDLKPENVFLTADGHVKVLDFGLAYALGRRRVDGGTPAYMAPEQRAGAGEDERTDVFALGVILHRMLAGELPFAPDDEAFRPPPPLKVPGRPGLGPLVARMLAADPAGRPRDGAAVLAALGAAAAPRARRRRWWVGGAAGLAALALAAWLAQPADHAGTPAAEAPRPPPELGPERGARIFPESGEQGDPRALAYAYYYRGVQAFEEALDVPLAAQSFRRAIATADRAGAGPDAGRRDFALPRFRLALLGEDPGALAAAQAPGWSELLPDREKAVLEALRAAGDEARARWATLAAAHPRDKEIQWLAGRATAAAGDLSGARRRWQAALAADAAYLPALDAELAAGGLPGAGPADDPVTLAQRAVTARPGPATYAYLAQAYAQRGDLDEAVTAARRALQGEPRLSLRVAGRLAGVLVEAGRGAQAVELLRPLTQGAGPAEAAPRAQATWELARALAVQGKVREVRALAARARAAGGEGGPGLAEALEGLAAFAAGDRAGAAQAWGRAARASLPAGVGPAPALAASVAGAAAAARACEEAGLPGRLLCQAVGRAQAGDARGAGAALREAGTGPEAALALYLAGEVWAATPHEEARAAEALERYLALHDGLAVERLRAAQLLAGLEERLGRREAALGAADRLLRALEGGDADLPVRSGAAALRMRVAAALPSTSRER